MTFSPEWANAYESGFAHKDKWINPDLALLVNSIYSSDIKLSCLELGCGAASNYLLFKQHGISYSGVDGSMDALIAAIKKFPELDGKLVCCDFTVAEIPQCFHIICDRAAVAHNDTESIRRCISAVYKALPVGGLFVGVDWFSIDHSEYKRGDVVDTQTRTNYPDGQFVNIGKVHFTSQAELEDIFADFRIDMLRERIARFPVGFPNENFTMYYVSPAFKGQEYVSAWWDIVARKV